MTTRRKCQIETGVFVKNETGVDTYSVQGQRHAANGAKVGSQFQVNTYTTDNQTLPAVAIDRHALPQVQHARRDGYRRWRRLRHAERSGPWAVGGTTAVRHTQTEGSVAEETAAQAGPDAVVLSG